MRYPDQARRLLLLFLRCRCLGAIDDIDEHSNLNLDELRLTLRALKLRCQGRRHANGGSSVLRTKQMMVRKMDQRAVRMHRIRTVANQLWALELLKQRMLLPNTMLDSRLCGHMFMPTSRIPWKMGSTVSSYYLKSISLISGFMAHSLPFNAWDICSLIVAISDV